MKVFHKHVCKLLLFLLGSFIWVDASAQSDTTGREAAADSIQVNVVKQRLREKFKDSVSYESDTVVALLLKKD